MSNDRQKRTPMDDLESLMEHVGTLYHMLGMKAGEDEGYRMTTPQYHVKAIHDYGQRAWQTLARHDGEESEGAK